MAQNLVLKALVSLFVGIHMVLVLLLAMIPHKKVRELVHLGCGFPFFFCSISLDRLLFPVGVRFNPFVRFPRNTLEVTQRGAEFFEMIQEYNKTATSRDYSTLPKTQVKGQFSPLPIPLPIPAEATFVSLVRSGETDDFIKEHLKKIQVSFYHLTFAVNGKNTTIDLFVKTPGQRTVTRPLLALGTTFSERGQEQRFYEDILPHVDPALTNVPHGYACFGSRAFSHVCIVAAKVDTTIWRSTTDAQGMTLSQGQALVKASARLHSQFWNPPKDCPKTIKFVDRTSLSWIGSGVKMYLSDKEAEFDRCPPWMPSLWATLWEFYKDSHMCVSHADCRPGNMLFSKGPSPGSEQSKEITPGSEVVKTTELIMTDWEACSIVPASYDFCYSMICGFPPYERRQHQRYLWEIHYEALQAALKKTTPKGAEALGKTPAFPETKAKQDTYVMESNKHRMELEVDIHPVVIYYFGWLLAHIGGVGETQGNLEGDGQAWGDRIRAGMLDNFLCDGGVVTECNDGYSAWTGPHNKNGVACACKDKTTMGELNVIHPNKGNMNPVAKAGTESTKADRTKMGDDGAIISAVDPDYSRMHLSGRMLHFLEPYHKQGRLVGETMQGADKSCPKRYNRTLREDLLGMVESAATMGMNATMKKAKDEAGGDGKKKQ